MAINYEKLSNVKKVELLESTVLTGTPEDVSAIYSKIGIVEMPARALGIACRFRGLDWVIALIKGGAQFYACNFAALAGKYGCGVRGTVKFYDADYSMMILDDYKFVRPKFNFYGQHIDFKKPENGQYGSRDDTVLVSDGKEYPMIGLPERVEIVKWLTKNVDKDFVFNPGKLLFYAILTGSTEIADALTGSGVSLPDEIVDLIVNGNNSSEWTEWLEMLKSADTDKLLSILSGFSSLLKDNKLVVTQAMIPDEKSNFMNEKVFAFIYEKCNTQKLNAKKLLETAVAGENVGVLSVLADHNALSNTSKRDVLIDYASANGKTQALAWLLDYKNRTADFAKESKAAEEKLKKSLSVPKAGSAEALKKEWKFLKQEDGTIVLTEYKGNDTVVEIPAMIGKTSVTALAGTFASNKQITSVTIPDGIIKIGLNTFFNCETLTHVNIPNSVAEILKKAFSNTGLEEITIPGSVKMIPESAFSCCKNLKKLVIKEGVKEIGKEAFLNDQALVEIELPEGITQVGKDAFSNTGFVSEGDDGLKYVGNYLIGSKGVIENCDIRDGTVIVVPNAFTEKTCIKTLRVPGSVKKFVFGHTMFSKYDTIEKIQIDEGVEELYCELNNLLALKDLCLPSSLIKLSDFNVSYCSDFTIHAPKNSYALNFAIQKGATYLASDDASVQGGKDESSSEFDLNAGWYGDQPNSWLHRYLGSKEIVSIPDSVIVVDSESFKGNKSIKKITLNQTEKIRAKAFYNCENLEEVEFGNKLREIGDQAFSNTVIKDLTIPDTVTSIGYAAFGECKKLIGVSIPESVTYLVKSQFAGCSELREVTISSPVVQLDKNVFTNCNKLRYLHLYCPIDNIPAELKPFAASSFVYRFKNSDLPEGFPSVSFSIYIRRQKKRLLELFSADDEIKEAFDCFLSNAQ